jgi:arylsulfatase A-like enzyme
VGRGSGAAGLLVPLIAGALACTRAPPPAGPPDLVLILVNELRADPPGVRAAEDAFLDALKRRPQARFTAAYTQTVTKSVALGSLLTGRYPSAIPLCGLPAGHEEGELPPCARLPSDQPTLAAVLGHYGYRTALFSTDLAEAEHLSADFDHAEHFARSLDQGLNWSLLEQAALAWWRADPGKPRLLVVSTAMDDEALNQAFDGSEDRFPIPTAELDGWIATTPHRIVSRTRNDDAWPPPSARAIEAIRRVYAEVAEERGEQVRGLLDALEPHRDAPRPSWWVVGSLRGMGLGEYSGTQSPEQAMPGNTALLMDANIRVPLAVFGPDRRGPTRIVETPVQLLDLLPTLCGLAEAMPPARLDGDDLLAPPPPDPDQPQAYAEFGDMLALRQGRLLLRFRAQAHGRNAMDPMLTRNLQDDRMLAPESLRIYRHYMLHDVVEDPFETRELTEIRRDELLELRAALIRVRTEEASPPQALLDSEIMRGFLQRKALHYW